MNDEGESQRDKPALLLAGAIVAMVAFIGIGTAISQNASRLRPAPLAEASQAPADPEPLADDQAIGDYPSDTEGWEYSEFPDAIRGGKTQFASLVSDPTFGPNNATLKLILKMQQGKPVAAEIASNIPLLCYPFECTVPISLDGATGRMGFRTTTNGIGALWPADFVTRLSHASVLVVEVPTAEFGSLQFRFNVAGLKWNLPLPKPARAGPASEEVDRAENPDMSASDLEAKTEQVKKYADFYKKELDRCGYSATADIDEVNKCMKFPDDP